MAEVWAVGGVDIPPAVTRMLAYVASGGAEGVAEPGGLKVAPLATPGTSVRVLPGAAVVRNRYAGGSIQSYIVGETTQQTVPITATGSGGGRTDLVIARVEDPQYAGSTPGARFEVMQGVPAGSGAEYAAALPYPALALARVTLPASTATVQATHITDLRTLAAPRRDWQLIMGAPGSGSLTQTAKTALWAGWQQYADIPSWCTHMQIVVTLSGYQAFGDSAGYLDVRVGSLQSADVHYDTELPAGQNERRTHLILGGWDVPTAMRGTRQLIMVYGSRVAGKPGYLNFQSAQVGYDVRYSERAS